MKYRIIIISVLLSLPLVVRAAVPGPVDAGEAFLRQLQKRDSVLIADQVSYGFRLDGLQEGSGQNGRRTMPTASWLSGPGSWIPSE